MDNAALNGIGADRFRVCRGHPLRTGDARRARDES